MSGAPRTPRASKKLNKHTQPILSLRSHFKPVGLVTGLGNSIQIDSRLSLLHAARDLSPGGICAGETFRQGRICAGKTFRREGNLCRRNVSPGAEFVQAKLPQRRGARSLIRLFPQAGDGIFGIHLQNIHALERYVGGGVVFL